MLFVYTILFGWYLCGSLVGAWPEPFLNNTTYIQSSFTPVEDLSVLSEREFSVLAHPKFPHYSVRIKRSTAFCDTTVRSYTGYIDIEARHIFFYFFESRSKPDEDDVIFWTNGGPGCSSTVGLFMELGPCKVVNGSSTQFHPESWNTNANVFFVDQPIGVGFSYADFGEVVSTTEEAAKDIASFIAIFFAHFSKFQGRAFHMAGESYGGRYLPVFASAVYDQNAHLIMAGMEPINLRSVMIGNGLTDPYSMEEGYYATACTSVSVAPILDIGTCVRAKQMLPRCMKAWRESCLYTLDEYACKAAMFCNTNIFRSVAMSGKNPYDISKDCEAGFDDDSMCYPVISEIATYLNIPAVRETLGVDPGVLFMGCNNDVNARFDASMDKVRVTYHYVAALLERSIRVLIYVGTNDFVCNHVGNEAWTLALEWSGRDAFVNDPLRPWIVNGKQVGMTRSANGLTYASIWDAGHMAPYDKPEETLQMLNRWLREQPL